MPRKCAFYNCPNNNVRSLYRFPTNDQNRLKLWLTNAGNRILESLPLPELRNRYLCEYHFDDHFVFKKEGKKNYLKRNAVPHHYNHADVVSQTDSNTPVPPPPTEDKQPTSTCVRTYVGHVSAQKKYSRQKNTVPVATSLEYDNDEEDQPPRPLSPEPSETHLGFTCYACFGPIRGFRYSCVECDNFDLCARCEAMREHDHHYMLRVPGPRPEGEVHAIAAELRAALEKQTVQTVRIKEKPGIKFEVEFEEPNVKPGPLYPDPTPVAVVAVTSMIYPETEVAQQDGHSDNKASQEIFLTIEQLPDKRQPSKVTLESGHQSPSSVKLKPADRNELAKRKSCADGGGSPSKIVKTELIKEEPGIKCEVEVEEPNVEPDPLYPDPTPVAVVPVTSMIYPETEVAQQDGHSVILLTIEQLPDNRQPSEATLESGHQSPSSVKPKPADRSELAKRKSRPDGGDRPRKIVKTEPDPHGSDETGDTAQLTGTLQAQGFTVRNIKEENPDILHYCDT